MIERVSLSALVLIMVSCGGSQPPPAAAPPAEAPAPSAAPAAPSASIAAETPATPGPIDWKSMDKAARGKYMKDVFTAFNAKYADMNCATCHGSGVTDHTFAMPNPELPKLPADMSKFKEWAAKKPEMTEFMLKHVKPEMAKLLNEPEYSPETKTGFGCGECHTMATK